ncbi:MAG: CoA transferase, partial [Pseudomonadota bacterium]
PGQEDRAGWPALHARFADVFASRTRDDWAQVFDGTDACVAPVLTLDEAAAHPHLAARGTYVEPGGVRQAAPAPRLSATPGNPPAGPRAPGADTDDVLRALGLDPDALRRAGAVL